MNEGGQMLNLRPLGKAVSPSSKDQRVSVLDGLDAGHNTEILGGL